jgi:hypothetical protein
MITERRLPTPAVSYIRGQLAMAVTYGDGTGWQSHPGIAQDGCHIWRQHRMAVTSGDGTGW